MNTVRYVIGILLIVGLAPAILHWLTIHPFIGFWRRLGPVRTYLILAPSLVGVGFVMYWTRGVFLSGDLGTSYVTLPLAVLLYVVAVVISIKTRKQLTLKTFVGVPELTPTSSPTALLTEGVYSRVRHPRYVSVALGTLGFALFINYIGVYALYGVALAALYLITVLEERELLNRYGEEYRQYAERVPRFVPRSS